MIEYAVDCIVLINWSITWKDSSALTVNDERSFLPESTCSWAKDYSSDSDNTLICCADFFSRLIMFKNMLYSAFELALY